MVVSVGSRSLPYENLFYRVSVWLNCPPYAFDLRRPIHLKSLDMNCRLGHCPVIPLNPVILQSRPLTSRNYRRFAGQLSGALIYESPFLYDHFILVKAHALT
jgi:hypothetical protein